MYNRSYHFIPANKPKLFDRLSGLNADAYILDLEDAVPSEQKPEATQSLLDWCERYPCHTNLYVRVNGVDHPMAEAEREIFEKTPSMGIVLPKLRDEKSLRGAIDFYTGSSTRKVIGLIESPEALFRLDELVGTQQLSGIGLGLEDFLVDTPYHSSQLSQLVNQIRTKVALAAMRGGIEGIDTISLDLSGGKALKRDVEEALSAGLTGKFSIHPNQLTVIHSGFSPRVEDLVLAGNLESELDRFNEESGYFRYQDQILSPPKIKKLKNVLQFKKQHQL
jgi:citrate lyase subunit beta / citryl-CoA lyase